LNTNNFIKTILFINFLFITVFAHSSNKPNILYDGFSASYSVSKNDFLLGISERKLSKLSNKNYRYSSLTYATGVASWFVKDKITEQSNYSIQNKKIIPSQYEYRNSNGKVNDNFDISFDNKNNTATRSRDKKTHKINNNKQDTLSFQIAIMLAMQNKTNVIKYTIIDNDSIKEYSLVHSKNEKLETKSGVINTQVMESRSNNNKDRYIFWCSEKYNYLPIKIQRIEPNGDVLLIQLDSINGKKIEFIEAEEDEDY